MEKKQLRDQLLKTRKALSAQFVEEESRILVRRFKEEIPVAPNSIVHLFRSVTKFNEVNTQLFLDWLFQERNDIRIALPRVVDQTRTLDHHLHTLGDTLVPSRWGIEEPMSTAPKIVPNEMDLIIVPLLGFDRRGYRIGYGGGFYDKFLIQTRPDCRKIGIAFDQAFQEQPIPIDKFDVPLNAVVTPTSVFHFSSSTK